TAHPFGQKRFRPLHGFRQAQAAAITRRLAEVNPLPRCRVCEQNEIGRQKRKKRRVLIYPRREEDTPMIRLARRASLLVAFYVLASAATATAECAWVLWVTTHTTLRLKDGTVYGKQSTELLRAFPTVAECGGS